ncbi:MAG: methionine--tRNA ligase [Candidatus Doudnabacteria bacterium RIFCSPLOWO2_02_FULL_48_8]|uniref:Methionine--tRNA ligase n=1 Tax=Candidatus Doudnabacteria bacterium RIFCSPHIGHO2_01_FULL_46_24 TaxID=1817825 RepID=A0A1F5NV29_9BACT|nr:MAG: methionine--tRNA ligase [Candidatus Doudnabacteria bacterium RIFCSPHIGHO2_01_FULL_46_24]OGE95098.1 MAG: methionine--tRNA ligase [Candidatus Doudnabacteria bacterium RIFCSPLOWO2_02_FULL_48_8]
MTDSDRKKFYITTPIYYVNDKPHIGSAYSTLAADVLARLHRSLGEDVLFLTGTAEHGSKIAESAERAGKKPQEFADENAAKFSLAWDILGIAPDDFIRTTEERHLKAVNLFFTKLKDSGKLYEGEYEGWYCVGCESFKKESELVNGLCPLHNRKPELVKEKNWFFKLSEYGPVLLEKIKNDEFRILPHARKNEMISFIEQGLEDIAVSRRTAKFAMPLPWDKEQTIYVWLDELFNYCSAIGYESDREKFDHYWPADFHIIGKDIIKFHCIIWPALLLAIGEQPPKAVFAHGFFTFGGQKMSKTLGNVIDPVELAQKYTPDAVRYFLLREVPFGHDGDISEDKLKVRYNGDLANGLGNLFSRVTNMVEKFFDGDIETVKSPKDLTEVTEAFYNLDFSHGLEVAWQAVAWADALIDKAKPWELVKAEPDKVRELLRNLVALLADLALKLSPIMPDTANKIRQHLEAEKIVKSEPLFPKVN